MASKEHPAYKRYLSLAVLTLQGTCLSMVVSYSRRVAGPKYFTTTAVFLTEILKFLGSLLFFLIDDARAGRLSARRTFSLMFTRDCWKVLIPATLYALQNNLQYVALGNLDPATYQVTSQLKILTTALFSILLLKRAISVSKWGSLFLLMGGVALVQLPAGQAGTSKDSAAQMIGLAAVLGTNLTSGLAGVYLEKIIKTTEVPMWMRNVQLCIASFPPALFGVMAVDGAKIAEEGFFYGYTPIVWCAVILGAVGGLATSCVMKYADNILKCFSVSMGIILSTIASVFVFDIHPSATFLVGASLVLLATFWYSRPDPKPAHAAATSARPDLVLPLAANDKTQAVAEDHNQPQCLVDARPPGSYQPPNLKAQEAAV